MSSQEPKPGVIEGQTLEADTTLTADACIIGSGPGGAVTAHTLALAGLKVIVLEEGGYFTKNRFRMLEADAYPNLYQDGAARTTKDLGVNIYQGKAVGGGTVINWTTCFRTPDDVVEHWRSRFNVKGFDSTQLEPFFRRAEERLGVAKVPEELMNRNNRLLFDGCQAMGWEVDTIHRNVVGCAQTGACGLGCPIDAKRSMLVTYLPDAMNLGATVVSRCRVERLVTEGARIARVEGKLLVADGTRPTGHKLTVEAKRIIVACGAINSPALLLRSGISNESGMLGRRTFLHPVVIAAGLFDEPVEGFYGAPQSAASHQFAHPDSGVGFFFEAAPVQPGLASGALPGFGSTHREMIKRLPLVAAHIALTIDGFQDDVPGGEVRLGPGGRAVLDYPIAAATWQAFRRAHRHLAELQLEVGAREVMTCHEDTQPIRSKKDLSRLADLKYEPGRVFVTSAHQMGGCLMSDDRALGVVRSDDLRHHSVENLHVIDGSVFPTSLGVNPQMSIYGLAGLVSKRLADAWAS